MKIAPSSYLRQNVPVSFKTTKMYYFKNDLQNDVFVKNANDISFKGGKINQKYGALNKEITDYILTNEEISFEEIEKIIQKYSPTTKFEKMENLETDRMLTQGTTGYTKIPTEFYENENGKIICTTQPKTIYLCNPKQLNREEKIILLSRILHECTHVLQEESKDRTSSEDFFSSHFKNSKNIDITFETMCHLPNIFTTLENISNTLLACSDINFEKLPEKLKNPAMTLDKICLETQKQKAVDFYCSAIIFLIRKFENSGAKDISLILDYIILKAQNEQEAYQNALTSDKQMLNLNCKTNFDLRNEEYAKMIEAAKQLKGRKNILK